MNASVDNHPYLAGLLMVCMMGLYSCTVKPLDQTKPASDLSTSSSSEEPTQSNSERLSSEQQPVQNAPRSTDIASKTMDDASTLSVVEPDRVNEDDITLLQLNSTELAIVESKPDENSEQADVELLPNAMDDPTIIKVEPLAPPTPTTESIEPVEADPLTLSDNSNEVDLSQFDAQHVFQVILAEKQMMHPNYGKGHTMGFVVNNQQGKSLVVKRGESYAFDVKTNIKHDFYLSTSDVGWGASAYVDGVSGHFTYQGHVFFQPTATTPDELYYQCRNHQSMGGRIFVVSSEQEYQQTLSKLQQEQPSHDTNSDTLSRSTDDQISKSAAKQKLSYANLLLQFKTKGIPAAQLAIWQEKLSVAQQTFEAGHWHKVTTLAASVAEEIQQQSTVLSDDGRKEQNGQYQDALASLQSFEASHEDALKRAAKKNSPDQLTKDYDHGVVDKLKFQAAQAVQNQNYAEAIKHLAKAERIVTLTLKDMLSAQTLVYDLNFDTPEAEYKYELNRYQSYAELIPVAIEVKKPRPQSIKLMREYESKGQFFRDKAREAADAKNYSQAIVIIGDATTEIRRGLMLLGVTM